MDGLRKMVTALALAVVVLAFAAPALAQAQSMPLASPTAMPGRMPGGMQGGTMMPMEQSGQDMMATLKSTKDTGMAASIMKTAGLEGVAKPDGTYTLFVASDAALKATSPETRNAMMEKLKDRQMAIDFVKGHMISGTMMPDGMTDGRTLTMMNGKTMTVKTTDGRIMVDDANIIKAIKTRNGIVYVMDKIPSSIMSMIEGTGAKPAGAMPARA